jgi:hypothetical protein
MRSLISLSAAALLALAVWPVDAAVAQSRKKKAARATHTAAQGIDKSNTSSTAAQVSQAQAPAPIPIIESQDGIARITPASAREAVEKGRAVIVDVRSEDSYNAGHVKGARWINLNEIEARVKDLPRDKMIITYCS